MNRDLCNHKDGISGTTVEFHINGKEYRYCKGWREYEDFSPTCVKCPNWNRGEKVAEDYKMLKAE